MSGLFGALSSAAWSLDAQQRALETVGQNLANIDTPGYARRTILFAEVPPGIDGSGGGVTIQGIQAARDVFTQQRLFGTQPLAAAQSTIVRLASMAQGALGTPGQSLDADLTAFFGAWSQLASNPTSAPARQAVVLQAQTLGQTFADVAGQLKAVASQADQQVRSGVQEVHDLADRIASLNAQLAQAGGASTPAGAAIQDQLYASVDQLSKDVSISVMVQGDGQLNVAYAAGRPLVIGGTSYGPTMAPGANADVLAADGTVITSDLGSGSIAGALQIRDQMVPAYLQQLDQLAYTVVQQVNSLHASGFDLSGQPGGNFFTPIANVAGAASAIAVDPAIVADPSKIAAASTTAAGDNGNAKAIANLAGANVLNGATLAEGWGSLMARVGRDTQTAQASSDGYAAVIQQLQAVNDATSGVSINDEAAMLLKFQRAYQANAQFFSTVNDAITTLFNMIG